MTHTKKLQVLIIEDRALISDLLSLSLEETGDFETTSVSTVKRAFEVKADKKFDLVTQLRHFAPDLSLSGRCRGQ
jgi:PleD family two-component response regulator